MLKDHVFIQFYRLMKTVLNSLIHSEYDEAYARLFLLAQIQ